MKGIARICLLQLMLFFSLPNYANSIDEARTTDEANATDARTMEEAGKNTAATASLDSVSSATPLSDLIEPLLLSNNPSLLGQALAHTPLLAFIYQNQQYQRLWQDRVYAKQVIALLEQADQDGLTPSDYHVAALHSAYTELEAHQWRDPYAAAQFDVLLSDAVLKFAYHLSNGKLNPADFDPSWNYDPVVIENQLASMQLLQHIQQQSIAELFANQRPQYEYYQALRQALASYQEIADQHEFTVINMDVKSIKPHTQHAAIPAIKIRLQQLGYVISTSLAAKEEAAINTHASFSPDEPVSDELYSADLVDTIKVFQQRHDLEADGIIGRATLAALNLGYQHRVDLIRINLERARWLASNLTNEFIIVNIAGFELFLYQNSQLSWQTKVVVGSPLQATPIFKSQLQYLEFNPTWTVPRSIVKEMWHKIQSDPNYLASQHFQVVQDNGRPVSLSAEQWAGYTARNFPYHLVQQPWVNNALGQVKFIFPNQHSIFLHDTPQKHLFSSAQRTFSHGCIRVENPMELARRLLRDESNWSAQDIEQVVNSEKRTRVNATRPIDVFLMYWTVSVNQGQVIFHQDPYHRDQSLLQNL